MNFKITGTADKRPIVYPLLYALNHIGSTAFITDDTSYRRLITDGGDTGDIGNVTVITTPNIFTDTEKIKRVKRDYEHIVCCTMTEEKRISGFEIIIGCGNSKTAPEIYPDSVLINIGFEQPVGKKSLYIPLTLNLFKSFHNIECEKKLMPIHDARVINILAQILAEDFEYSVKNMRKLLNGKGMV